MARLISLESIPLCAQIPQSTVVLLFNYTIDTTTVHHTYTKYSKFLKVLQTSTRKNRKIVSFRNTNQMKLSGPPGHDSIIYNITIYGTMMPNTITETRRHKTFRMHIDTERYVVGVPAHQQAGHARISTISMRE